MDLRQASDEDAPQDGQMPRVTRIAAFIWYMPDDYPICRAIMTDSKKLPHTHAGWREKTEGQERRAILGGYQLYRVPLTPEAFQQWCQERQLPLDARGRVAFAADAVRHRHAAASARKEQARLAKVAAQVSLPSNTARNDPLVSRDSFPQGADAEASRRLREICAAIDGVAIFQAPHQLRTMILSANDAVQRVLEDKVALEVQLALVEKEAVRLAEFHKGEDHYVKVRISPNSYIYREKNPGKFGNALSFCPNCFEGKRISILEGHPFGVCRICNFRGQISWRSYN